MLGSREETTMSVCNIKVTQVISLVAWLVSKRLSATLRTRGALPTSSGPMPSPPGDFSLSITANYNTLS